MINSIEILKRLISFDTTSSNSNEPLVKFVLDYLSDFNIKPYIFGDEKTKKYCLHARIGPEGEGGVVLSGHTDVVPTVGQQWLSDPYELREDSEHLYGRGTSDMKGFLACSLAAIPKMIDAKMNKPVYLSFSYDEELGCLQGSNIAKQILKDYDISPCIAIIGEPTGMEIVRAHKGIMSFETTVKGTQGHSSLITEHTSAIYIASKLIHWLEDKMYQLIKEGFIDDTFYPNHSTIHVGIVNGGTAFNIIAGNCTFSWEIRDIPSSIDIQSILNDFHSYGKYLLSNQKDGENAQITTSIIQKDTPYLNTPPDNPSIKLCSKLLDDNNVYTKSYATEAGQFQALGYDSVLCGPGYIEQAHKANEYIDISQMQKCDLFLHKLVDFQSQ